MKKIIPIIVLIAFFTTFFVVIKNNTPKKENKNTLTKVKVAEVTHSLCI